MGTVSRMTLLVPYALASYRQELVELLQRLPPLTADTVIERLLLSSAAFLGKPYLGGALGEGIDGYFDQSPLYRTDAFDCLTYVNTVLALTFAHDFAEFTHLLTKINYYSARPDYLQRYHFMSADWNIANARLGLITDVTAGVVDKQHKPIFATAEALIDRPNWLRHRTAANIKLLPPLTDKDVAKRLAELHAAAAHLSAQQTSLPYLPLSLLFDQEGRDRKSVV